jgi:hypothetical protein
LVIRSSPSSYRAGSSSYGEFSSASSASPCRVA